MLKLICALLVMVLAAAEKPPKPAPIPSNIARDAYELYSQIYGAPHPCDPFQPDEVILVSPNVEALPNDARVLPESRGWPADERTMVGRLIEFGKTPYLWDRPSDFGRRIRILDVKEEAAVSNCLARRTARAESAECSRYAKVIYVRGFSLPSFNRDHTRAVIYTRRWCGRIQCGGQELSEYRKIGSKWIRQDGFGDCEIY